MKKIFCLLLAVCLLILPGCSKTPAESSSAPDPVSSSEPAPSSAPVSTGEIINVEKNSYVNVRSAPGMESEVIGKALLGEKYTIDAEGSTGDWKKIDYKGKTGFVYKDYIILTED